MIGKEKYKPLILNIISGHSGFSSNCLIHIIVMIDDKARPIKELIAEFERNGNLDVKSACSEDTPLFSAIEWSDFGNRETRYFTKL